MNISHDVNSESEDSVGEYFQALFYVFKHITRTVKRTVPVPVVSSLNSGLNVAVRSPEAYRPAPVVQC